MIKHPEYFTRDAFASRRRGQLPGADPEYFADYLANVFQPNRATFVAIEAALKPITEKYEQNFAPIRHKLYAHRGMLDSSSIQTLINKGLITELQRILYFMYEVLQCIWQIIHNSLEPNLGNSTYSYRTRAKMVTEGALKRLLGIPCSSGNGHDF